jgi:ankyrin repeat protein
MTTESKASSLQAVLNRYASHPMFGGATDIDVNSRAMDGDSVLHKAVAALDIDSICVLLDNGADPNSCGDMGSTPLHEAIELEQLEIAEVLLKAGASPSAVSEFGQSALDIASLQPDRVMLNILLQYTKNISISDP